MSEWRARLHEYDPAREPIQLEQAQQIRHTVVEAARASARPLPWRRHLVLACIALVVLAAGADQEWRGRDFMPASAPVPAAQPPVERRQLQFSTPGGTRIIWEINPQFRLTETAP